MYNRYIPQPDGSFRKSQLPDNVRVPTNPVPKPVAPCPCEEEPKEQPSKPQTVPKAVCKQCPARRPKPAPPCQEEKDAGIGSFLKQLLPKDFDVGELMVVLLLLLISSDGSDDQNTALLTLALYLFL